MNDPAAQPSAAGAMDRMYRYQRYIYDITRKFYLLGRDTLIDGLAPPIGGSVLEIACGTGRNLVRAAHRYPTARLCGLDVSDEMLKSAHRAVENAGVSARVRLQRADATDFTPSALFQVDAFDRIFISYAVSMIPPWKRVVAVALSHLAPGGSLHIVDFGQLEQLPPAFRRGLFTWLDRFHVTPRAELHETLELIASEGGATLAFKSLRRGYAAYAILTRPSAAARIGAGAG